MEDEDREGVVPDATGLDEVDMDDLQIIRELTEDLLLRLAHPDEDVREAAVEALVLNTEDEDWRAHELIRQRGVAVGGKLVLAGGAMAELALR